MYNEQANTQNKQLKMSKSTATIQFNIQINSENFHFLMKFTFLARVQISTPKCFEIAKLTTSKVTTRSTGPVRTSSGPSPENLDGGSTRTVN